MFGVNTMISVIIPTYNEENNIKKCLDAITNQDIERNKYEIIIVDGNSTDNTVKIASECLTNKDKIIIQKTQTIEGARNDGVFVTNREYKYIAMTDADCTVPRHWLRTMIYTLSSDKTVAVYGPIKTDNKKYTRFVSVCNTLLKWGNFWGIHHMIGANSAFDKQVFNACGGYTTHGVGDDWFISTVIQKMKLGKIKYSKDMYIDYSTRRVEHEGMTKFIFNCIMHDINIISTKKHINKYYKHDWDKNKGR